MSSTLLLLSLPVTVLLLSVICCPCTAAIAAPRRPPAKASSSSQASHQPSRVTGAARSRDTQPRCSRHRGSSAAAVFSWRHTQARTKAQYLHARVRTRTAEFTRRRSRVCGRAVCNGDCTGSACSVAVVWGVAECGIVLLLGGARCGGVGACGGVAAAAAAAGCAWGVWVEGDFGTSEGAWAQFGGVGVVMSGISLAAHSGSCDMLSLVCGNAGLSVDQLALGIVSRHCTTHVCATWIVILASKLA